MTLGFSTEIAGKPCYFPEKIAACLGEENGFRPKAHSIRKGKRWRKGVEIHMVTGNRTKDRKQFDWVYCRGVQEIEVFWTGDTFFVIVDNYTLDGNQIEILAQNDGFDNAQELENYFEKNMRRWEKLEGQIVHWTNARYIEGNWVCRLKDFDAELQNFGLGRDAENDAVKAFFELKECLNRD